ncbi:MAG: DUF2851 family protein [Capnocytophaga sp.]|nr:DUF2851 family protein [Capnocytophaga sp.]
MKEDFLHYIWKNKKIPTQNIRLTDGTLLTIESFGTYNTQAGPDIFNARLIIDGQRWAGNVEMHIKSSHWYAHQHETDPAYANVILHAVWEHDVEIFGHSQKPIPTLELKNIVNKSFTDDYKRLLYAKVHFIPCEKYYQQTDAMTAFAWQERLFVERLENKSGRVAALLAQSDSDWEKVLFLMLLRHLGGAVNGDVFLQAGKRLDFAVVRKESTDLLRLEALFFGICGLLDGDSDEPYRQELQSEYQYLKHKYQLGESLKCHFSGLRPQGFPTLRLSQLAMLYHQKKALFSMLVGNPDWHYFQKNISVKASPYWDEHYTFGKISKKSTKKWTPAFVSLVWMNVITPVLYLYQKHLGNDYSEFLSENMRLLPSESNTIVQNFEKLGVKIHSAYDSQVLLQQYKEYCVNRRCMQCSVGVNLLNFNKLNTRE